MSDITINKVDDKWAAYVGEQQVTKPACKGCTIKLIKRMTRGSSVYENIIVVNEDGTNEIIPVEKIDARKAETA